MATKQPNILILWGDDIGILEHQPQQQGLDGLWDPQY